MSPENAKNTHKKKHSFVYDMADEYRADTLARLAKISVALEGLAASAARQEDLMGEIKTHTHSIKGTSNTFGFSGLSVVAHAMDDFLLNSQPDDQPAFMDDLGRLNNLMISIASASDIIHRETGEKMLSKLHLQGAIHDDGPHTREQSIALLVMAQGDERNAIARTLEILGLNVITARDGVLAIELATIRQPDIIVTTLHSDRLSAPELIQVFAEINATASTPVIVVLPEDDKEAGSDNNKEAIAMLTRGLPPAITTITQGTALNRLLSAKLVELGIISP